VEYAWQYNQVGKKEFAAQGTTTLPSRRIPALMPFEILHCLLVFLCRSFCLEGAKISSLTRLRILLAGIQPVLAGFQLPDHDFIGYSQTKHTPRANILVRTHVVGQPLRLPN
jgi:hypothetical protein